MKFTFGSGNLEGGVIMEVWFLRVMLALAITLMVVLGFVLVGGS
jgi:hypothetical protein